MSETQTAPHGAEGEMTREKAIAVLVDHAKGIVSHDYTGDCPDTVEGPDSRDPHCPVCKAIDAIKEGER